MSQERLIVIGVCGEAEHGKDAVGKALEAMRGFHVLGLADGIRGMLDDLDGRTWEFSKERNKAGISDRKAMQDGGTECREDINAANLWLDLLFAKIRYASHYHSVPRCRFVIPDVRHPREVRYLEMMTQRFRGVYETWKVYRPGHTAIKESAHSSETSVAAIMPDLTLVNDQGLGHLRTQSLEACDRLLRDEPPLSDAPPASPLPSLARI